MATIKSHTDINQSKKLAQILPLESADMWFANGVVVARHSVDEPDDIKSVMPCWSLAALLDVLKDNIKIEKTQLDQSDMFTYSIVGDGYNYRTYEHEELIDACYKMILKLHKLKML